MRTTNKLTRQQLYKEMRETEISCGKCGMKGHLTPMGFLCPHCTFGKAKEETNEKP